MLNFELTLGAGLEIALMISKLPFASPINPPIFVRPLVDFVLIVPKELSKKRDST